MGDRLERPEWLEDAAPVRRVVHGPADERYASDDQGPFGFLPGSVVKHAGWVPYVDSPEMDIEWRRVDAANRRGNADVAQIAAIVARPHREAVWTVRNEPLDRDR